MDRSGHFDYFHQLDAFLVEQEKQNEELHELVENNWLDVPITEEELAWESYKRVFGE